MRTCGLAEYSSLNCGPAVADFFLILVRNFASFIQILKFLSIFVKYLCFYSIKHEKSIKFFRVQVQQKNQVFRVLGDINTRGGVEDTRLEAKAKAKDTKKIRGQGQGQGQPFRGQTLSRPRTGMLEAKAKDQGHKAQVLSKKKKKKKVFTKIFQAISKKIFQAISTKKRFPKNFSSVPQNFNIPKNSAVLEPRTGQFSRT